MATAELIDQETALKERLTLRRESKIADEDVYTLSSEEKKIIEERHREIKTGVGIPHEEVCKKAEQWFQQKANLTKNKVR